MEITSKNSSITTVPTQKQTVNATLESGAERKDQELQLSRIDARTKAQESLEQNRLKRRQQAEQQTQEQVEKRLNGRMVTDARQENVQRMDDIAHARAMQNKVEETYTENRQNRIKEENQQENVQRQQDVHAHRNMAIDLVV